ncbi:hypothetical protein DFH07DRAFT_900369 [Mycena maculata]|uniref:NAD(P)-binding protein n=1 Tax=Mycena maculata TaxID=230809 RepID=A0AAD7KG66_9AGAR|nr:hypothetical protein DFH07DRAFT_900369 [Mycena maculata]
MSSAAESKGVALVTGAAQGIGRAIALQLAEDGFDVALNDIAAKETPLAAVKAEVIKLGRRATVVSADVSVDAEVKDMVARAVAALGGLDVMVANAAICKARGSLLDVPVDEWDQTFAINVRGVFLCYQHAARQMILQGRGGRIIGACSGAGKQGYAMLPDYSSSKFAVRGLTQAAAQEFGKHGITVNCYAPGTPFPLFRTEIRSVITPMIRAPRGHEQGGVLRGPQQAATGINPTPEDMGRVVSFLADKGSGFITGAHLPFNSYTCDISADGGRYFD